MGSPWPILHPFTKFHESLFFRYVAYKQTNPQWDLGDVILCQTVHQRKWRIYFLIWILQQSIFFTVWSECVKREAFQTEQCVSLITAHSGGTWRTSDRAAAWIHICVHPENKPGFSCWMWFWGTRGSRFTRFGLLVSLRIQKFPLQQQQQQRKVQVVKTQTKRRLPRQTRRFVVCN